MLELIGNSLAKRCGELPVPGLSDSGDGVFGYLEGSCRAVREGTACMVSFRSPASQVREIRSATYGKESE
ncbi:hypothetical protein NPIL_629171, partial [Nephila pilipes]